METMTKTFYRISLKAVENWDTLDFSVTAHDLNTVKYEREYNNLCEHLTSKGWTIKLMPEMTKEKLFSDVLQDYPNATFLPNAQTEYLDSKDASKKTLLRGGTLEKINRIYLEETISIDDKFTVLLHEAAHVAMNKLLIQPLIQEPLAELIVANVIANLGGNEKVDNRVIVYLSNYSDVTATVSKMWAIAGIIAQRAADQIYRAVM